jgi:hypothetical protein
MNPQNSPNPSAQAGGAGAGGNVTEGGGTLTEAKQKIAQTAKEAATKMKTAASNTASRVKDEAGKLAAETKDTTAGRIRTYSSAIHETASSLEEKDPNIAWFTHRCADRLQGIADYMRNHDFSALRHDAEDVARRHPAAFFGGMFLAGLVIGNFVKASRRKLEGHDDYQDYTSDWMRGATEDEMQAATPTDAERAARGI